MKRKVLSASIVSAVVILCIGIWRNWSTLPSVSPNSPAVGTWQKGGLAYVLDADGTGYELLGRKGRQKRGLSLKWNETNGVVTLNVHDLDGVELKQVGRLSRDKRTLIITQLTATKYKLLKSPVMQTNWALQKQ